MKNGKENAKQLLLNKINNYCNIAIGSVSGVFAGNAFAVIKGFMKNPDAYIAGNSAPWYTPLITSGIGTAVIIAAIAIGKKVAASKLGIDLGGTSNEKLTVTKSTLVSGGAANQQVPEKPEVNRRQIKPRKVKLRVLIHPAAHLGKSSHSLQSGLCSFTCARLVSTTS